jgi:hypothetical protein
MGYTAIMMTNQQLRGLRLNNVTDLHDGRVNNRDMVVLLLGNRGGTSSRKDLLSALRTWRPGARGSLSYGYLFSTFYDQVAASFLEADRKVFHAGTWKADGQWPVGHHSNRRMYWYRTGKGVYALTAEGYRRLGELTARGK